MGFFDLLFGSDDKNRKAKEQDMAKAVRDLKWYPKY